MTNEKRKSQRAVNLRQIAKKRAMGWVGIGYTLPPEVARAVVEFKNIKMREWREAQPSEKG